MSDQEKVALQVELNKLLNDEIKLRQKAQQQIDEASLVEEKKLIELREREDQVQKFFQKRIEQLELEIKLGGLDEQARKDKIQQLTETIALERENLEVLEDQIEAQERSLESAREALKVAEDIAGVFGVKKFEDTFFGQMSKMDSEKIQQITRETLNFFTATNIGYSMIEKVVESSIDLARSQENAISSFKRATGAGVEFNDLMIQSEISLRTFGVGMDDVANATAQLYENTSLFTEMSRESQEVLVENTAIMQQFGIEGSKNLDILTKSLGMTAKQSAQTARDLVGLSKSIGLSAQTVLNDFGPAMTKLAAHGDEAVAVFKSMAAASKATGLEMNALLGIAEGFDTFEDAAQSVGKLNALLGGPYLNSIEMINANEEERIRMLLESIELSGRSFSELGKYEQKAIAAAAGISDMAEANELFNTSLDAYDLAQMRAKSASLSQKEFQEASKDLMTVFEKGQKIMEGFAVSLRPVLTFANYIADAFLSLQEATNGWFGYIVAGIGFVLMLVGGITALGTAVATFVVSMGSGIATMLSFGAAAPVASGGAGALASTLTAAGTAAATAQPALVALTPAVGALGVTLLQAGLGLAAAGLGLAAFIAAFSLLSVEQMIGASVAIVLFTASLLLLIPAIGGLSASAAALAPGIAVVLAIAGAFLVFGAAIALVGAGILFIGKGIQFLAEGLCSMFECLSESGGSILLLYTLSNAMLTFVSASLLFGPAVYGIATAFQALTLSLVAMMSALDFNKLSALATTLESIAILSGMKGGVTVANQAGGAKQSPFTNMVNAVNSLSEEKANQAARVASIASNYNASVDAQSGGGKSGGANLSPLATAKEVNLVLNGQIFGKLVADLIDKQKGLKATVVAG